MRERKFCHVNNEESVPAKGKTVNAKGKTVNIDTKDLGTMNSDNANGKNNANGKKIAVAGTGYVGLSLACLLAQHNDVTAVDIIPEKVEKINNRISPIQDEYIEKFLAADKDGTILSI